MTCDDCHENCITQLPLIKRLRQQRNAFNLMGDLWPQSSQSFAGGSRGTGHPSKPLVRDDVPFKFDYISLSKVQIISGYHLQLRPTFGDLTIDSTSARRANSRLTSPSHSLSNSCSVLNRLNMFRCFCDIAGLRWFLISFGSEWKALSLARTIRRHDSQENLPRNHSLRVRECDASIFIDLVADCDVVRNARLVRVH